MGQGRAGRRDKGRDGPAMGSRDCQDWRPRPRSISLSEATSRERGLEEFDEIYDRYYGGVPFEGPSDDHGDTIQDATPPAD